MDFCKVRAFVLKVTAYSESDLIVSALLESGQRQSFIAKGAKRSKKRFGPGVLQPTHFVSLSCANFSQEGKLPYLTEAKILDDFSGIRSSYKKMSLGLYFLGCVGKIFVHSFDKQVSASLFLLLGQALRALETEDNLLLLEGHFKVSLLKHQGVLPQELMSSSFSKTPLSHHRNLPKENFDSASVQNLLDNSFSNYIESGNV